MKVDFCLNSISQIPKLTPEAELSLCLATFNGCEKSKQALIFHLLQFLMKSLRTYRLDSELFDDCLSEGTIAIIRAVGSFNPHRGFTISSYVSWFIHSAIRNTLRKHNSLISIPKGQWYKAKNEPQSSSNDAIAKSTLGKAGLPKATVFSDIADSQEQISCSSRMADTAASAEGSYLSEVISEGLERLSSFERQVISAKYGFGLEKSTSSRKLAQKLGCTRSAVLKAEESAHRSLRTFFTQKGLRSFIEGDNHV